jgi:hypothetical protein
VLRITNIVKRYWFCRKEPGFKINVALKLINTEFDTSFAALGHFSAWYFFMAQQPLVGQSLFIDEASRSHSDTPHSIEFFWKSDQPDTEICIWQHMMFTKDRDCHDSNPQSQQANSHRPTPYTPRPLESASSCHAGHISLTPTHLFASQTSLFPTIKVGNLRLCFTRQRGNNFMVVWDGGAACSLVSWPPYTAWSTRKKVKVKGGEYCIDTYIRIL